VRELYEKHAAAVLAYAERLTRDRGAAEDVLQETMLRAWRHPEVLRNGKGSVRGWLMTVAQRIVIDRARALSARPTEQEEDLGAAPPQRDHSGRVIEALEVIDAIRDLPEEQKAVIMHLYFCDSSLLDSSSALDVPKGTVKSRAHYALRALRKSIGGSVNTEGRAAE
jgi:RNA polymerase sigma-70 factor (ECF subfamily)